MKNYYRKYLIAFVLFSCLSTFAQNYCVGEAEKISWHFFKNNNSASFEEMSVNPNFPNSPDAVKKVFSTKSPAFYDNNMSGRLQGYIRVPSTTTATFNITAQNRGRFYLSTDQNPINKVLLAHNDPDTWDSNTDEFEHNRFTTQTSSTITLLANTYYYFDIQYVAGGWSDQVNLYWKTDLVSSTTWNIITSGFLYDIGCNTSVCPPLGTVCNDNNPATANDIQDGNCNCFGSSVANNSCIGERGRLENFTYFDLLGYSISSLTTAAKFPTMPSTSTLISTIGMPSINRDSLGHYLQGFLRVPITGVYKFNICGDDQTSFYLSSNDSITNKNWRVISVTGWTDIAEHDKYPTQTTGNIQLEAGKYYYFEILNKEGGGGDHYSLYWQTPFTPANTWKKIPSIYAYDYKCSLPCIPAGTACDDGNPFTKNDVYVNCDCVGTPCSGPDCTSPLASYKPYDKCNVSEQLDNNLSNNWLSCNTTANPNPTRSNSHWLRYDLGKRHKLISTHLWNYNMPNETNLGFGLTAIDYSTDGINWTNLDTFNMSPATGGSGYGGQPGPDVEGIYARYVLFTSLDGTTGCRGLSKVAFQAVICPAANTPCDDGNRMTLADRYTANCECIGMAIEQNPCVVQNLMLGDSILSSNVFGAQDIVQAISTIPSSPNTVGFVAGKAINLLPGFETLPNALFLATIDDCVIQEVPTMDIARMASKQKNKERVRIAKLEIEDLNADGDKNIKFFVDKPGIIKLELLDVTGELLYTIIEAEYINDGYFEKQLRMQKVNGNDFIIRYTTSEGTPIQKEF